MFARTHVISRLKSDSEEFVSIKSGRKILSNTYQKKKKLQLQTFKQIHQNNLIKSKSKQNTIPTNHVELRNGERKATKSNRSARNHFLFNSSDQKNPQQAMCPARPAEP